MVGLLQGIDRGVPGQRRALNPGGKRMHTGKGRHFGEILGLAPGGHDILKLGKACGRLVRRAALDLGSS